MTTTDSIPTASELCAQLDTCVSPDALGPLMLAAMTLGGADLTQAVLRAAVRLLPLSNVPITVARVGEGN